MGALTAGRRLRAWPAGRVRAGSGIALLRGATVAVTGAIALAGLVTYVLHRDLLAVSPGPTPFAPNTAVALCLLTVAVARDGHPGTRLLAALGGLVGALTLGEYVLETTSTEFDALVFAPFHAAASVHPGRMAPNTAGALALVGCAVLARGKTSTALGSLSALIGFMAVLGYTHPDASALASLGDSVTMLLPTGVALTCLSLALVLGRERDYLSRDSVGGTLVRRMVPATLVLPVVGGAFLLRGMDDGLFMAAVGIWSMTVVTILLAVGGIFWVAHTLDRQEMRAHAGLALHAETARNLVEGLCVREESTGEVLSVNPALEHIFGYSPGEIVGTSRLLLTDENEILMREALADGELWEGETETVRADGSVFWCSVKGTTFHHPDHGQLRVALYHDVTERRRTQEQKAHAVAELERSNQELEQFAHVASHDLSEPLRVIGGFVALLQRRYQGQLDESADRYIEATVSGVERMQSLIDALLAYSRVGSGALDAEPVDTGELVRAALRVQAAQIEETGAQVTLGSLPVVMGDAILLERVFQNLISNAIKFKGEGTADVSIEAERAGGGAYRFSVTDNGVGIPPEHADRVFGMFQRLQGRAVEGTGIGLSITRRVIERHGGRIWVEPAPGGGTTFFFTLPGTRE